MSTSLCNRGVPVSSGSWMSYFGLASYVSRWFTKATFEEGGGEQRNQTNEEFRTEDWTDWEWVMSSTEEVLQKHRQSQMANTEKELNSIRGNSLYFRLRPQFLDRAVEVLDSFTMEERILLDHSPLDSSKRSKVITDVIRSFEDDWRFWIRMTFFEGNERWSYFEHSYSEQQYSKNTVGILREVGWQASHGYNGTLNPRVLADITWSIWNALRGSIRGALERELTKEELTTIAERVCLIQTSLVHLWLETVHISKGGREREGLLVRKWQQEAASETSRLAELRASGRVDERYEEGPVLVQPWEHSLKKRDIVAMLSKQLTFPQRV